ncbi:3-hydroxyacyl-CoA dehydrogenase [Burkholderia sp. A1]|uniref:3-hydroxyacyl-CoA dehydrogenase n=1 Tax=Burkholderia sp. A1 TaxID=148446 RepID=UPI00046A38BC|nr:3-hydroxyacyl-CoA dehydrogenase [Burkholderia sp. A1]
MKKLNVAIVGVGIIGCSWALVWARQGHAVALYDADAAACERALATLAGYVDDLAQAGLPVPADTLARVRIATSLADAVAAADFVQESVPEKIELKRALFVELDALAPASAVLGSSTSALGMSRFTEDLPGRARCLIVHPATPPHLMPVVEIVPAPWTDAVVVERVFAEMEALGQTPVLVRKEVPNFVMNRMQGALLIEMFRLIEDGVISAEHADKLISDGFGLRWAFLGPLEGVDLNAPGGIADYLHRFGHMFDDMASEVRRPGPVLNPRLIERLDAEMRARLPLERIDARRSWRNRRMAALQKMRREMEPEE